MRAFARLQTDGTCRKSATLYHGVIGFRSKPAAVQIGDPKAALSWTREHLPGAVTETIDCKALAERLLMTGEVMDFAVLVPAEEQFYIR